MNKIGYSKRVTPHINRKPAQEIFYAIDFARYIDRPLNLWVVINLRDDASMCQTTAFDAIRKKYRVWQKYALNKMGISGIAPTYVYSHENPENCHPHVNWMVHVPPALKADFYRKVPAWAARVLGDIGPFDIRITEVTGEKELGKYFLKGIDPDYISHFHLANHYKPQGDVFGKRVGHSPSIGLTERKKVGFDRYMRRRWKQSAAYQLSLAKAA